MAAAIPAVQNGPSYPVDPETPGPSPGRIPASIELGRFDPARMKDPEIHGELYQKGPQYDYENVRAYVPCPGRVYLPGV